MRRWFPPTLEGGNHHVHLFFRGFRSVSTEIWKIFSFGKGSAQQSVSRALVASLRHFVVKGRGERFGGLVADWLVLIWDDKAGISCCLRFVNSANGAMRRGRAIRFLSWFCRLWFCLVWAHAWVRKKRMALFGNHALLSVELFCVFRRLCHLVWLHGFGNDYDLAFRSFCEPRNCFL